MSKILPSFFLCSLPSFFTALVKVANLIETAILWIHKFTLKMVEAWPTWSALWRPLLVAGAGAAIVIVVLLARGPDAWRNPPNGIDVVLVSLGIGALILLGGYWFSRRSRKPVLQG